MEKSMPKLNLSLFRAAALGLVVALFAGVVPASAAGPTVAEA
jgi:hypothetical protein